MRNSNRGILFLLIFLVVMMLTGTLGISEQQNDNLSNEAGEYTDISSYRIVYPATSSSELRSGITTLQKEIFANTDADIEAITDLLKDCETHIRTLILIQD